MIFAKKSFVCEKLPTEICHASTVLKLENGDFISAWFGGSKEGEPDVDIWVAVRKDGVWQAPFKISVDESLPHWNPVLFQLEEKIALYFKVGSKIADWKTYVAYSYDNGASWSNPAELIKDDESGGRGPVKNKPIRLINGMVLAPASVERSTWSAFVDISQDNGLTWERSQIIEPEENDNKDKNIIQPTLWQDEKGVHMLLRSNQGVIYRSDSFNEGRSWCKAYKTDLPNNNSGIDLAKLSDGRLVLVCNPVGEDFGARTPLSLFVSDDGEKWKEIIKLEWEEGEKWGSGEFSYPAVISDGNTVYVTYTYKRKNVAFWEIEFN